MLLIIKKRVLEKAFTIHYTLALKLSRRYAVLSKALPKLKIERCDLFSPLWMGATIQQIASLLIIFYSLKRGDTFLSFLN